MIQSTRQLISFVFLTLMLIVPGPVMSATQTIDSTVSQTYGGIFSAEDARVVATVKARRQALEKAGTYIESLGIVKQPFTKEDLPVLAAGILEAGIAAQKNYVVQDGFVFEVTARINVNTKTLTVALAEFLKDETLFKKYQDIRNRETGLLSRMNELIEESRDFKAVNENDPALRQRFQETTNALSAAIWYNKALDLLNHQSSTPSTTEKTIQYLLTAVGLDPEYGPTAEWLGRLYSRQGKYDLAVKYYRKALEADRQSHGSNSPDLAAAYNRLGLALHRNGQYDQALETYLEAWKIQIQTLGENHPDVATTYNNIGEAWRQKGDFDRAIEYYKKDLEISLETLGRNHPNVATSYNNLAYAYHGKGDDEQAIAYFEKALKVYRIALGEDHPQTKTIEENITFLKDQRQ